MNQHGLDLALNLGTWENKHWSYYLCILIIICTTLSANARYYSPGGWNEMEANIIHIERLNDEYNKHHHPLDLLTFISDHLFTQSCLPRQWNGVCVDVHIVFGGPMIIGPAGRSSSFSRPSKCRWRELFHVREVGFGVSITFCLLTSRLWGRPGYCLSARRAGWNDATQAPHSVCYFYRWFADHVGE